MATYLDMGNNYIYNVKEPIKNDQATNKGYVDGKLDNKVNKSIVQNVMRQVLYKAGKRDPYNYLKRDGSFTMTGNLNMSQKRMKGLPTTTP